MFLKKCDIKSISLPQFTARWNNFYMAVKLQTGRDDCADIEILADKICSMKVETPALFILELHKTIFGITSTLGAFVLPLLTPLMGNSRSEILQNLLLDPEQTDQLIWIIKQKSIK